jgi:hypothetical protein
MKLARVSTYFLGYRSAYKEVGYEVGTNERGEEMKPNPQEKCMTIKTRGRRTLSFQLFPIMRDANVIAHRYAITGRKKMGAMKRPLKIEKAERRRLIGGAKYLKLIVP